MLVEGAAPIYVIRRDTATTFSACLYTDCTDPFTPTPAISDGTWYVALASYKTYFDPADYTISGVKVVLHLNGVASVIKYLPDTIATDEVT